jgi:hypothetical protein
MIQGLLPSGHLTPEQLDRTLLEGRYCEIRMLFYVGKDIARWIEQCIEAVDNDPDFAHPGYRFQSFAQFLVEHPPANVKAKLQKWGVSDYRSIFTRAIGLNAMFAEAPAPSTLSDEFVRNYYRYADSLFTCRQKLFAFSEIRMGEFDFDLYASGEYTRMLERQWEDL